MAHHGLVIYRICESRMAMSPRNGARRSTARRMSRRDGLPDPISACSGTRITSAPMPNTSASGTRRRRMPRFMTSGLFSMDTCKRGVQGKGRSLIRQEGGEKRLLGVSIVHSMRFRRIHQPTAKLVYQVIYLSSYSLFPFPHTKKRYAE